MIPSVLSTHLHLVTLGQEDDPQVGERLGEVWHQEEAAVLRTSAHIEDLHTEETGVVLSPSSNHHHIEQICGVVLWGGEHVEP